MDRYKKLGILLGVLAAVCLATLGVMKYEEHQDTVKNSDEVVLEIDPDAVTAISWEYGDESLSFHRDGDWRWDGDDAFPVDAGVMQEKLELFREFGVAFIIEDVEDYGQYGLDTPVCTVSLTAGEQDYTVKLGDYSSMDSRRYVDIGDGRVYLVQTDPLDYFDGSIRDMIDNDEIPAFGSVSAIRFSGAESWTARYDGDGGGSYREEDVWFAGDMPLDTGRVEAYLDAVSGLDLTDYAAYDATEEDLADYGLDDPELTVAVDHAGEDGESGETFILSVSRDPEEREKAGDGAEDGDETVTAYARVGESRIVYRLDSAGYESLMAASRNDLRHREILPADLEDVKTVEVTLEGSAYVFTASGGDGERVWSYDGTELESTGLPDALESLAVPGTEDFTDEAPAGREEARFTVTLDREDGAQVETVLYRYDGAYCLATVDGESVGLVPRSDVVAVVEAVNAVVLGERGADDGAEA